MFYASTVYCENAKIWTCQPSCLHEKQHNYVNLKLNRQDIHVHPTIYAFFAWFSSREYVHKYWLENKVKSFRIVIVPMQNFIESETMTKGEHFQHFMQFRPP